MRAGNVTPPLNMLIGDEREVVGFVHPDGTRQPVPTYAESGAVEFADGTPGLTPAQVTATQALVSVAGNITTAALSSTTGTPGQIVKLSDGDDKGSTLVWSIPDGASTYAWCWQIYPLAAYL